MSHEVSTLNSLNHKSFTGQQYFPINVTGVL